MTTLAIRPNPRPRFQAEVKRPVDRIGEKYARWTIVGTARTRNNCVHFRCRCDCGREATISSANLYSGKTRQCAKCGLADAAAFQRSASVAHFNRLAEIAAEGGVIDIAERREGMYHRILCKCGAEKPSDPKQLRHHCRLCQSRKAPVVTADDGSAVRLADVAARLGVSKQCVQQRLATTGIPGYHYSGKVRTKLPRQPKPRKPTIVQLLANDFVTMKPGEWRLMDMKRRPAAQVAISELNRNIRTFATDRGALCVFRAPDDIAGVEPTP